VTLFQTGHERKSVWTANTIVGRALMRGSAGNNDRSISVHIILFNGNSPSR